MNPADAIPIGMQVAGAIALGIWALADRLRVMSHDVAKERLNTEEIDHEITRTALVECRRRLNELEARFPAEPAGE